MALTNKPWFTIEQAEFTHYLFVAQAIQDLVLGMERLGFPALQYAGVEFHKGGGRYVLVKEDWQRAAKAYLDLIVGHPEVLDKLNQEAFVFADELFKFGKYLLGRDFSGATNNELADAYDKFEKLHAEAHARRVPMWLVETGDELFTRYMVNYLEEAIKKAGLDLSAGVVFATLSTPLEKEQAGREKEEFLRIALELKSAKNLNETSVLERLSDHIGEYRWLPYGISGPAWEESHFAEAMRELLKKDEETLEKELEEESLRPAKVKKDQEELLDRLSIDEKHRRLLKISSDSIIMKARTKDALFFGFYAAEEMLKEIASRLNIDLRLLRYMLPWEMWPALLGNGCDEEELEARWGHSFQYVDKDGTKIFSGERADKFVTGIKFDDAGAKMSEVREIKGTCARQGQAKGAVRIVNSPADMVKMNAGDILVSRMTDPQIVAAMKKSAAIITDMGGITCHAAIVARELHIPCVIGTKIATKVLKDGDMVEVDAEKGIVKKI